MIRKDFNLIAYLLGKAVAKAHLKHSTENILDMLIDDFSHELKKENPRFDEKKFRKAILE